MLHKCANPACLSPFRHLGEGKLFQIEMEGKKSLLAGGRGKERKGNVFPQIERYWLCDQCSSWLTLAVERGRGVITVPLPDPQSPAFTAVPAAQIRADKYSARAAGLRVGG
jgi:hypothetical protein